MRTTVAAYASTDRTELTRRTVANSGTTIAATNFYATPIPTSTPLRTGAEIAIIAPTSKRATSASL